jgi:tight adherence protein B
MNNLLMGAAALAVVALFEGLYYALAFLSERKKEDLRRRLHALGGTERDRLSVLRAGRLSSNPTLDGVLASFPALERLGALIDEAQVGGTVAGLLAFSTAAALIGGVAGLFLRGPAIGALLFCVGAAAPTARLYLARESRSRKLSQQLPSALDMMARSLRAGHALTSAFKLVATEMPGPINLEFARAYEEQNLGLSFEHAVLQMTVRAHNNRDMKIFAVSVIVQKETGGNLVEILEKLAETIRSRYQFYGKLAALSAEGKLSGIVLGGLPIVIALMLMAVNHDYLLPLVTSPMGRAIVGYAIISWVFGLIWLRQMGKVEL